MGALSINLFFLPDNRPPFLKNCPDNIVTKSDPGLPTALVNWTLPVPEDNVDMKPRLVVNPNGIRPPHRFPAGKTYVVYTAIDNSGLRRSCSFSIQVQGVCLFSFFALHVSPIFVCDF